MHGRIRWTFNPHVEPKMVGLWLFQLVKKMISPKKKANNGNSFTDGLVSGGSYSERQIKYNSVKWP